MPSARQVGSWCPSGGVSASLGRSTSSNEVVELEDDVALGRVRAVGDHRQRLAVGREDRLADPGVPVRPLIETGPLMTRTRVAAAVGLDAHDVRDRHLIVAQDVARRPVADAIGRPDEVDRLAVGRPGRHGIVAAGGQLLGVLPRLDPDVAGLGVDDRARDLVLLRPVGGTTTTFDGAGVASVGASPLPFRCRCRCRRRRRTGRCCRAG